MFVLYSFLQLVCQNSLHLLFTGIQSIICVVLVLGVYWILTRPQKAAPEMPTVIVEPVVKDDVEIYGEYVGRIRAQQFVEVRARVEGYLENMLFAEGTYVNKNQVLFVINQDQYRAKSASLMATVAAALS